MYNTPFRVLVLCTGNSARSIIGEVLFNAMSGGRVVADSAGSQPAGRVNPAALRLLAKLGHDTSAARSKSWHEFTAEDAEPFDAIITVCDSAATEQCPIWPGHPLTAHWGIPDPAAVSGTQFEIESAFQKAHAQLRRRIECLLRVRFESMPANELKAVLNDIAESCTQSEASHD